MHKFTHEECVRGGKNRQEKHPELKKNLQKIDTSPDDIYAFSEQLIASQLEKEGWTIFSPTVVCDRIGIKDGHVYLIEFKKEGQSLTENQSQIQTTIPTMYKVVYYPNFFFFVV